VLTDAQVRKAKAAERRFKLYDGGGLYLSVEVNGSKLWRMRYVLAGKEKLLSFGPYPEVGLSAARDARDAARAEIRIGHDPSLTRQAKRAAAASTDNRFEKIARDWFEQNKLSWRSQKHRADVILSLESNVFPELGGLPVMEITAPMVLNVLRKVERRSAVETAHRIRQRVSAVFRFAIASGLAESDPAAAVGSALKKVVKNKQPAVLSLDGVREMLTAAEAIPAHAITRLAHRLLALTSVRPSEVRAATWAEFSGLEGTTAVWTIPAARMKAKRDHTVPLSRQAIDVLRVTQTLTGKGPLPFPNIRWAHKPMSENAMGYLLNRAGYAGRHVPHGWRAAFSTIMNEAYPADRAAIDLMLAHAPKDAVEAAYNRAQHLERRRQIAQTWADMLLEDMPEAASLLSGPAR
jgi:integrase